MSKQIKNLVVYKKLTDLKQLEGNPRTITKDKMNMLVESIKNNADYFEARPIICSDRTGELVILAGNQRHRAAKIAGLEEVPTIILHGLSEEKEKEIIIRDNVELGDWDLEVEQGGKMIDKYGQMLTLRISQCGDGVRRKAVQFGIK